MVESNLKVVSDIIDNFDLDDIVRLFEDEISNRDSYHVPVTNHFQPLYVNYTRIMEDDSAGEDDKRDCEERYVTACLHILSIIQAKFGFTLDDGWLEMKLRMVPPITLALYSFFVLDLYQNVLEILKNYITRNYDKLVDAFKDYKSNTSKTKVVTTQSDVITRNIYDICSYILSILNIENVFDYIDEGYVPRELIMQLIDTDVFCGDFMPALSDIFNKNIGFKSQIGFDIIHDLKKRQEESN